MRHKTITLCPTTYEIAKEMPNFSQWIRDKLLDSKKSKPSDKAITQYAYECDTEECEVAMFSNLNRDLIKCRACKQPAWNVGIANRWSGEE